MFHFLQSLSNKLCPLTRPSSLRNHSFLPPLLPTSFFPLGGIQLIAAPRLLKMTRAAVLGGGGRHLLTERDRANQWGRPGRTPQFRANFQTARALIDAKGLTEPPSPVDRVALLRVWGLPLRGPCPGAAPLPYQHHGRQEQNAGVLAR